MTPGLVNLVIVLGLVLVVVALVGAVVVSRSDDERGRAFEVNPPTVRSIRPRRWFRRARVTWW